MSGITIDGRFSLKLSPLLDYFWVSFGKDIQLDMNVEVEVTWGIVNMPLQATIEKMVRTGKSKMPTRCWTPTLFPSSSSYLPSSLHPPPPPALPPRLPTSLRSSCRSVACGLNLRVFGCILFSSFNFLGLDDWLRTSLIEPNSMRFTGIPLKGERGVTDEDVQKATVAAEQAMLRTPRASDAAPP